MCACMCPGSASRGKAGFPHLSSVTANASTDRAKLPCLGGICNPVIAAAAYAVTGGGRLWGKCLKLRKPSPHPYLSVGFKCSAPFRRGNVFQSFPSTLHFVDHLLNVLHLVCGSCSGFLLSQFGDLAKSQYRGGREGIFFSSASHCSLVQAASWPKDCFVLVASGV